MYRLFLSLRYLRRRRTNLIGVVGVCVAVWALITILSIMTGFLEQARAMMRGSLSDVLVIPLQLERPDGKTLPATPDPILELVRDDPRVAAAAPHLVWFGLVSQTGRASTGVWSSSQFGQYAGVKMVGVDVEDEMATTELLASLEREPNWGSKVLDPNDPFGPPPGLMPHAADLPRVVVGDQLFQVHSLARGREIELMSAIPDGDTGEWRTVRRPFVVAGTFRSGENDTDMQRVYVQRDDLVEFLGGTRHYSEVLVRLHDYERDGEAVRDDLRTRLDAAGLIHGSDPEEEVQTWEDYRGVLLRAIQNERVMMAIMVSLVLLVASFTIFALLSMMVHEKRRDVGILAAIGATPLGIRSMFLLLAFWEALVGSLTGAAAGWWTATNIDRIELWMQEHLGVEIFDRDVYLLDHIPSIVDPWAVITILAGAFLSALAFAAIPAWKASRLDPLEALRYE